MIFLIGSEDSSAAQCANIYPSACCVLDLGYFSMTAGAAVIAQKISSSYLHPRLCRPALLPRLPRFANTSKSEFDYRLAVISPILSICSVVWNVRTYA
jgi:hypothetical protein